MIERQLQAASFRGVPFFVPAEEESGGRKIVVHEFPSSDKRFVEDLGKLLPSFRVTALVAGLDVMQKRNRLVAALSQPGPGPLVHPYLGPVICAVAGYSASTTISDLGQVVIDIEFVATAEPTGLNRASGVTAVVSSAQNARNALDTASRTLYTPTRIANSIKMLGTRAREGINTVQGLVNTVVNPVIDTFNEANKQINIVRQAAFSLVQTPNRLADSFKDMFSTVLAVGEAPQDMRNVWADLTNFGSVSRFLPNGQRSRPLGSVRPKINRTTRKRIIEDDNLRIIDQRFRVEALINSFEAEAFNEFATDIDLLETQQRLAADFDRIMRNQDDILVSSVIGDEVLTDVNVIEPSPLVEEATAFNNSLVFDAGLLAAMENLRVATAEVLNLDVKNPLRVQLFDLGETDIQIATQQLYGSQDLIETIIALNSNQNSGWIRFPIKAVLQ